MGGVVGRGGRLYAGRDPAGGPHLPTGVAILDDELRVRSVGKAFTANTVRGWLTRLGVRTLYIERGSPWENG